MWKFPLLVFCLLGAFVHYASACDAGSGSNVDTSKPLHSCFEYKSLGFPTGQYEINPREGTDTMYVWCDMDEYGGGWTLTTRISKKHQQHGTYKGRYNVGDLDTATREQPSRPAKMSDADISAVAGVGGTRWSIVANYGTFLKYKRTYFSNGGKSRDCGYNSGIFSHFAFPADPGKERWRTDGYHQGGCGGWHSDQGWSVLSGINTLDRTYFGGYTGYSGSARVKHPDGYKYATTVVGNSAWHQPGFIFERAAKSKVDGGACKSCPGGMYSDGKTTAVHKNRWNKATMKGSATVCVACPLGTMSSGGASECYKTVSTVDFDKNTKQIKENKAALVTLEKKVTDQLENALDDTLKKMQNQLADMTAKLAAQRSEFDLKLAAQKTAFETADETSRGKMEAATKAAIKDALTTGTQIFAMTLPPAKSTSARTTCGGVADPTECTGLEVNDCTAAITGASVQKECPVLCNSCTGRENGPAIVTNGGTISFSVPDGDHVRIGNDFLLTAEEVKELIEQGIANAFQNVVDQGGL